VCRAAMCPAGSIKSLALGLLWCRGATVLRRPPSNSPEHDGGPKSQNLLVRKFSPESREFPNMHERGVGHRGFARPFQHVRVLGAAPKAIVSDNLPNPINKGDVA
jgi:hypothetical protein